MTEGKPPLNGWRLVWCGPNGEIIKVCDDGSLVVNAGIATGAATIPFEVLRELFAEAKEARHREDDFNG